MIQSDRKTELFQCPECGLHYSTKEWAERCQAWCSAHGTCHTEIVKHSIESEEQSAVSR